MSTDNAARFYWAKLENAVAIFEAGNHEKAQDICYNYWFAKSSLDQALDICVSCESYDKATERDLQALAEKKASVEKMLKDRAEEYRKHWEAEGREPPSMDEWYEIADGEPGDPEDGWFEVVEGEDGNPLGGPVEAWPFKKPVPGSFLVGKTFPLLPGGLTPREMNEQVRCQCEEEQGKQEFEAMGASKGAAQATEEVTQELRQLEISKEKGVDDGRQMEDAPLPPAASEEWW